MSLPVLLTSGMMGAPVLTAANGSMNALLNACLVNGFNTQSVVSATAASGVVTFNFSSAPGFSALDTVTIAGASNATVNSKFRVQSAASNQVLVAIPGVPDGAVGGTISIKFAPLGWTRPYSATNLGVYRQGGTPPVKRYVRVDDSTLASSSNMYMRGYEAMTAVSTGTGPIPTTAVVTGSGPATYVGPSSTTNAWIVLGTPRAFVLLISDLDTAMSSSGRGTFFGDLARVAKPADAYACGLFADMWPVYGGHLARAYTGASGSVDVSTHGVGGQNVLSPGFAYPCAASGGLNLADGPGVYDTGTNTLRGFFPGVLSSFQAPVHNAGATPLLPGALLTGITGVSGRAMVLGNAYGATTNGAMVLDEDWGDA